MPDHNDELVNVYDAAGAVISARPRSEAKRSGLAVGAVNVLLANREGHVLLQLRPDDKENGGLWDKSVGGHVAAGEDFDATALREVNEELFDGGADGRVLLVEDEHELRAAAGRLDLEQHVVFFRVEIQHNLRDVRHAPGGHWLSVLYHVGIFLGRTDVPKSRFSPQPSEIVDLTYVPAAEVDRLLLAGRLAPNMAYLWLAYGERILALARESA